MVVHNFILAIMPSRFSGFSLNRSDFFAIRNASIQGNIRCFFPLSRPASQFLSARFFLIPINIRQKAAYLARLVWYSLHK